MKEKVSIKVCLYHQKECLKRTCHKEKKICPQFGVDLTEREYELKQKYVDRGFGRCIDLPFRFKNKDNKELT